MARLSIGTHCCVAQTSCATGLERFQIVPDELLFGRRTGGLLTAPRIEEGRTAHKSAVRLRIKAA
jgi:hypothetical protein